MASKWIKALRPVTIAGIRSLLRGDVCDVPYRYERGAAALVAQGHAEYVSPPAGPAPRAPATLTLASPIPDASEVERLEAELRALEGKDEPAAEGTAPEAEGKPEAPRRKLAVCMHCGNPFGAHPKKLTTPRTDVECKGLRKFFKPTPIVLASS